MTDFAAVDAGVARDLVAMMDATDAWPAVRAARTWVLEQVALDERAVVVDAGCGTGTFGASVSGCAVDVDRSLVMLEEARRRRSDARVVLADVAHLPLRDGVADLVRVERVPQWAADPGTALLELRRVVAPGGSLAVTDTDWSTFTVNDPDPAAADRLARAALTWVPQARLAHDLPSMLAAWDAAEVQTRHDTVRMTAWDPDDPRSTTAHPVSPSTRSRGGMQPMSPPSPTRHAEARSGPPSPSSRASLGCEVALACVACHTPASC